MTMICSRNDYDLWTKIREGLPPIDRVMRLSKKQIEYRKEHPYPLHLQSWGGNTIGDIRDDLTRVAFYTERIADHHGDYLNTLRHFLWPFMESADKDIRSLTRSTKSLKRCIYWLFVINLAFVAFYIKLLWNA